MNKLDILNRDAFVEQLLRLTDNISYNKGSTCFAINGSWGCGKSFVLDMFEEKLNLIQSEETNNNKYFVIRYNSWKFDYYEEPLVAIVATIISIIEEKTKLFADEEKWHKILGVLKATGAALLSMTNTAIKEKSGIDLQTAFKTIHQGLNDGAVSYEKAHEYDMYFEFNKVLEKLSELLQNLAQDYTVIILVDELDRCLPEYAVKVLERLHHLTEEKSNIITIIAVDKEQLMSSVKQIFGFSNPAKYLEKFFSFEVKLNYGTVSEKISEKYTDYFELFDKDIFPFTESVEEYLQNIFKDIDIRTQEQLIKKAMIVHKLLFNDKKDYSFMCMELLLAVLICIYNKHSCLDNRSIQGTSPTEIFNMILRDEAPPFVTILIKEIEKIRFVERHRSFEPIDYVLPNCSNLYGAIAYTWYHLHQKSTRYIIVHTKDDAYESVSRNYEELKKFAETIFMMN